MKRLVPAHTPQWPPAWPSLSALWATRPHCGFTTTLVSVRAGISRLGTVPLGSPDSWEDCCQGPWQASGAPARPHPQRTPEGQSPAATLASSAARGRCPAPERGLAEAQPPRPRPLQSQGAVLLLAAPGGRHRLCQGALAWVQVPQGTSPFQIPGKEGLGQGQG